MKFRESNNIKFREEKQEENNKKNSTRNYFIEVYLVYIYF